MLDFSKTSEGHMKVRRHECSCWLTEAGDVGLPCFCPMFTSLVLKKKGEKKDVLAKVVKSRGRTVWTASSKDRMTRTFVTFVLENRLSVSNIYSAKEKKKPVISKLVDVKASNVR